MLAADSGHTETMQALAALGADIHIQDKVSPSVSCTQQVLKITLRVRALYIMKSTKVQTSPIYRNRALKHLPQSEPRAILGSK